MVNQYLKPVIVIPSALEITAISRSSPMVVTAIANTDQTNTYQVGQLVKFMIPRPFGMQQLNGLTLKIVATGPGTLSLAINSSNFDAFSVPTGNVIQPASLSPAGSNNLQYDNTTNNVPFQNLNNIGN